MSLLQAVSLSLLKHSFQSIRSYFENDSIDKKIAAEALWIQHTFKMLCQLSHLKYQP